MGQPGFFDVEERYGDAFEILIPTRELPLLIRLSIAARIGLMPVSSPDSEDLA
jgi:hypothetical protein